MKEPLPRVTLHLRVKDLVVHSVMKDEGIVFVERIAYTLEEGAVKFACMKAVMCRKGLVLGWEEVVSINL